MGTEMLWILGNIWHLTKASLRGITEREDSQKGVDFLAQLSARSRHFSFQFKALLKKSEALHYRYILNR